MRPRRFPFLALVSVIAACGSEPAKSDAAGDGAAQVAVAKSDCDAAKIAPLVEGLAAVDARAQRDLVAAKLGEACKLPPALQGHLLTMKGEVVTLTAEQSSAALRSVCPGAAVVMKQIADASTTDRNGTLFDRCKLGRFDLIDREAFAAASEPTVVPFYAYKWLQEQDVAEGEAKALARAIALLEQRDFRVDDQTLPDVPHPLAAVPDGIVVHVTAKQLRAGGRVLLQLAGGRVLLQLDERGPPDPAAAADRVIDPLFVELGVQVAKLEAATPDRSGSARLILVADAKVPFSTVADVLFTARRAGVSSYALVAESAPLRFGAVPIDLAELPASGGALPPTLGIIIQATGFEIRSTRGHGPGVRVDGPEGGAAWDYAALASRTADFKREFPDATRAIVTADPDVHYEVVLATLATVRGPGCGDAGVCTLRDAEIAEWCATPRSGLSTRERGGARRCWPAEMTVGRGGFLRMRPADDFGDLLGSADEDVWGGLTGTEIGEAYGVGSSDFLGTGGGGTGSSGLGTIGSSVYGRGTGSGMGKRVPTVRQAKATVKGSLDKDIIRRIVRAHVNEVRACYNEGLVDDPDLAGRVEVQFQIDATGDVSTATVTSTTVADEDVGTCIASAVEGWKFPRPIGGGVVVVTYPFVLSPG